MKNLLLISVFAMSFLPVKSFAKEESELKFLTPEQYANLYEADQKKYIMLMRQTAVDLSFQQEIGFFEGLNIKSPLWVSFFENSSEARTYTENDMQLQLNLLNKQADDYLAKRNALEYASQATGHLLSPEADRRDKEAKAAIVDSLFKRRNAVLDQILLLPENAQVNLARSLRPLDSKFSSVKVKARDLKLDSLRTSVQASLDAYDDKLKKLKEPAFKIARQPGLQIELTDRSAGPLSTIAPAPPASVSVPAAASVPAESAQVAVNANSCVRCIYGGFPISGTQKCSAVKTSEDMTKQLGTLQFPPPLKVEDFNCGDAKPVMCSPMFFGTLEGKAVCVAKSSSATKSCMSTVGNSEESLRSTDKMIKANIPAARSMMTRFSNICSGKSMCFAGAKRSDIEQTCNVVRERMHKFIEGMRTINGKPPATTPRPSTPTRTGVST